MMRQQRIIIQTTISADIDKVWNYWTQPEHIVNWNLASDDWQGPATENNLESGNSFRSNLTSKEIAMRFDFEGISDEVVDRKTIAYSMPDGRRTIVEFEKLDTLVKVTKSFDPEQTNPAEMQRAGCQALLDNFKKYVEMK